MTFAVTLAGCCGEESPCGAESLLKRHFIVKGTVRCKHMKPSDSPADVRPAKIKEYKKDVLADYCKHPLSLGVF